jgi:hypothetical protein
MPAQHEGFRNEALRAALQKAVGGNSTALEDLLMRYSSLPGPDPNLKLAAAFGTEIALLPAVPQRLLQEFIDDSSPPESPRSFLSVAAAFGCAALVRESRDVEWAWTAVLDVAVDARRPVRTGVIQALRELAVREGAADALVEHAAEWLEHDDPVIRFASNAIVFEVLSDSHVLGAVQDQERLLVYLSHAIDALTDATRSASRLEGLRRMLRSLVAVASAVVRQLRAADRGADWMAAECERAKHPDVRAALSESLLAIGKSNVPRGTVDRLRKTLETSAKPVRDAARVRPGTGRGRKTRTIR